MSIQIVKCKNELYYREYSHLEGGECNVGKTDYVNGWLASVSEWQKVEEFDINQPKETK